MANTPASRRVLSDQSTNAYIQRRGLDNNNNTKASPGMEPWNFSQLQNDGVKVEKENTSMPKIGQKRSIDHVDGSDEYGCNSLKQGTPGSSLMKAEDEVKCVLKKEKDGESKSECGSEMECALKMEEDSERMSGLKSEMECAPIKEDDSDTKSECALNDALKVEQVEAPESPGESTTATTIDLVEDDEAPKEEEDDTKESSWVESKATITILDEKAVMPKEEQDETNPSFTESKATTNILPTSFHGSQEEHLPLEEQFDIQDEASQKTLEHLNITPLPLSTSQPPTNQVPKLSTEGSQDSVGMSKFVDFDAQGAEEEDVKMVSPLYSVPSHDARRAMVDDIAKIARIRLQMAYYRVRTNQIYTPFAQLRRIPVSPPPTPFLSATKIEEGSNGAAKNPDIEQQKPVIRNFDPFPMPSFIPTRYPSPFPVVRKEEDRKGVFSSPPASTVADSENLGTSAGTGGTASRQSDGDLVSSVVQGEAANGLLELMRAATESSHEESTT